MNVCNCFYQQIKISKMYLALKKKTKKKKKFLQCISIAADLITFHHEALSSFTKPAGPPGRCCLPLICVT